MKKTKKNYCSIALAIGIITFASAAVVSFASSNGYGIYKNALKKFVTAKNYTTEVTGELSVDGTVSEDSFYFEQKTDSDSNTCSKKQGTSPDNVTSEYYLQEDGFISGFVADPSYENEDENYVLGKMNYIFYDTNLNLYRGDAGTVFSSMFGTDNETADKFIRFAEIASDLVIGDLKNNFIYEGESDGKDRYTISLDSFQIPEIISSGIDFVISANRNGVDKETLEKWAVHKPLEYLYQNVIIDNVSCDVFVDEDGNLCENNVTIKVEGDDWDNNKHEAVFKINIKCSDFGTTQPEKLDVNNTPHLQRRSKQIANNIEEIKEKLKNGNLSENDRLNYEDKLRYWQEVLNLEETYAETAIVD